MKSGMLFLALTIAFGFTADALAKAPRREEAHGRHGNVIDPRHQGTALGTPD